MGIAQWAEHPAEMPGAILTRVRVPGAAIDFSPRFSSVQFKIVSMRSEKPICASPRLSEVAPKLLTGVK